MVKNDKCTFSLSQRNLTNSLLQLQLHTDDSQVINIRVTDLLKTTLYTRWTELQSGNNQFSIDISALRKGFYKVVVSFDNGQVIWEDFTKY